MAESTSPHSGKGTGLVVGGEEIQPLRKPGADAEKPGSGFPAVASEMQNGQTAPTISSSLSVFAKEFVPRAAAPAPTPAPVVQQNVQQVHVADQYDGNSDRQDPLMDYVMQVLNDITYCPGHYEPMCRQLLSSLNEMQIVDEDVLQQMVEAIVSQAVWEPNFRYNGARLCYSLSRSLKTPADSGNINFRYILLNRCKGIFEDRQNLVQSDAEFLRGFALFMSELYVHMFIGEASTTSPLRITIIAKGVRGLMQTLLEHPTPANIKCLCQILKLSGSAVEEDDRATHHGQTLEMDQLMQNIRTCALTVEMPMHLKEMLSNVITLRASDWGRAASAASPTTSSVSMPARGAPVINADARGGVCYGPDGQILTAEERAFLGQSGIFHDDDDDDYDPNDDDDGMDDEMAQAFEEFLKMKDQGK